MKNWSEINEGAVLFGYPIFTKNKYATNANEFLAGESLFYEGQNSDSTGVKIASNDIITIVLNETAYKSIIIKQTEVEI